MFRLVSRVLLCSVRRFLSNPEKYSKAADSFIRRNRKSIYFGKTFRYVYIRIYENMGASIDNSNSDVILLDMRSRE